MGLTQTQVAAEILNTTVEELLNINKAAKGGKRGPASKLLCQIDQGQQLPRAKQRFVKDMLDTVIQQAAH